MGSRRPWGRARIPDGNKCQSASSACLIRETVIHHSPPARSGQTASHGREEEGRAISVLDDYTTRVFSALDHRFVVCSPDRAAVRLIDDAFAALGVGGAPAITYSLAKATANRQAGWELSIGGRHLAAVSSLGAAIDALLWCVNREAVRSAGDHLVFHASAAADDSRAILLAGPSGAGKTTLVTALVRRGLRYLTDEAVAVDPESLTVIPYPKPLCLEEGSQLLFPDLVPGTQPSRSPEEPARWLLAPSALAGPHAVSPPRPLGAVLVISHARGEGSRRAILPPSEAVLALGQQWLRADDTTSRLTHSLQGFARLVQAVPCYRLAADDLGEACRLIEDTL